MKNYGRNGRRGKGAALYVTMAGAFLVIAVVTAMGLFFKISAITVVGGKKYTDQEIIGASGLETDSSILFVNMSGAEVRIKNALPYVDSVKVTRKLPGTVVITVTEIEPAAFFTSGGSVWLMDVSGRILEETDGLGAAGVLEIRGISAEAPEVNKTLDLGPSESVRLRCLLNILKILNDRERLALTEWVDVSNLASVTFYYNGYRINVHQADDMETLKDKFDLLNDFFTDYPEPGHGQEVVYVDDKGYYKIMQ